MITVAPAAEDSGSAPASIAAGTVQAVRCRQGKCAGYLLEQRLDNLTDGESWTCTACSRSVPSLPPPGSEADASKYPGAVTEQFKQTWNQCITLQQTKVCCSLRALCKALRETRALLCKVVQLRMHDNTFLLGLLCTAFDHSTYMYVNLLCWSH